MTKKRFTYNEELGVAYFYVQRKGKKKNVTDTRQFFSVAEFNDCAEGGNPTILVDYDSEGNPIGVEILW